MEAARLGRLVRRLAGQENQLRAAQLRVAELGRELGRPQRFETEPPYCGDMLATWNKSVDFFRDPPFLTAYRRRMDSGHVIGRLAGSRVDIRIEWQAHAGCRAAAHACNLRGDFVDKILLLPTGQGLMVEP